MTRRSALPLWLAACALPAVPFALRAQQGPTQSAPTYTEAQAAAGKTAYDASCASCHGGHLDDGALAPALKGVGFVQKYGGKSVETLFAKVASMPPASPNSLGVETTARITAYLLQANAIVAGTSGLPSDAAALARMTIPVGGFSVTSYSPYAPAPPAVKRPNPLDGLTPISDAQLVEPAAQDWLTWRRSYDAHGFSPLTQITAKNVGGLRVAWSWTLPPGSSESRPLVHDGVMFVQGSNDRVQALDARTGDLLWQYERRLPQGVAGSFKRGLALHGNRLFMGTSDVHVIALDAKTGTLVWEQTVGDPKVREQMGGGPLVARGKVMIGTVGTGVGAKPGGPEIVGLDAETGRIAWRVHTIAQPDEQDDPLVVVLPLTDDQALDDLGNLLDLPIDLRRADPHPARVQRRIGSAVDDQAVLLRDLGVVGVPPHARVVGEIGIVILPPIRIVPEPDRHGWMGTASCRRAPLSGVAPGGQLRRTPRPPCRGLAPGSRRARPDQPGCPERSSRRCRCLLKSR